MKISARWGTRSAGVILTFGIAAAGMQAILMRAANAGASPPRQFSVSGNRVVVASGKAVRLPGVSRSGTEYECVHATNLIFDGPSDSVSQAVAWWRINAGRISLNEACWLDRGAGRPVISNRLPAT